MSLQFILGPSGAGKSYYIYNKIIRESMKNPDRNYILLVPEQYSMALQRKMVALHPNGGTMNIDVIGFNRLAYRVFDEQNVKPSKILEDFGKTMLIRRVAGSVRDRLTVYGGCLDKAGFIDEVKSLMSELYQYDVSRERLYQVIRELEETEEDSLLLLKLKDMLTIFEAFDAAVKDSYIVAEQLTELLAHYVCQSGLIKNSVIVMDGFTGFTPIQLRLIEQLLFHALSVYAVFTIDKHAYRKTNIGEHELFYLTAQTRRAMLRLAEKMHVSVEEDVFIDGSERGRWGDVNDAGEESPLRHLERNLFRYPYRSYEACTSDLQITVYENPGKELAGTAYKIRELVMQGACRYKDIAVISGDLDGISAYVEQLFPQYEIPYFLDYTRPVKNNPFIDALGHALRLVEDNFSYDSVFAFLKSGVMEGISYEELEALENYVLARGIKGIRWWSRSFGVEVEDTRAYIMELLLPFYKRLTGGDKSIGDYVEAVLELMEKLSYRDRLKASAQLYDKLTELFDKMLELMPEDTIGISEFIELTELGLKDLSLGLIPNMLDMVIVGDITRTRLDEIKVLFVIGVNDGIIPKKGMPAQIISDREKEKLAGLSLQMAPTEKVNSFIEQFYLYINMTKPKERLYLSYTMLNRSNEVMRPSYIIGRIRNIFPGLEPENDREHGILVSTRAASAENLIRGLRRLMEGDNRYIEETLSLYRLYLESGDCALIETIEDAMHYSNIPMALSKDVAELIRLRLMSQSVSRLEQYASCAYSYYLRYTLGLRERDVKGIDNRNIGNILHGAMERMYRHVHDNMNNDWESLSDEKRDTLMEGFVERAFDEEYEGQVLDEGRYGYLKHMLVRIGKRTARSLCSIGMRDGLKPKYFEYKFSEELPFGDEGQQMTLRGVIDRGDICYSKETGELRLRIIDYKSGQHDFKLSLLYEGLQLQLSVYMDVMMGLVNEQYNGKRTEDRVAIIPEGMYYYQMKDPYVEAESVGEAEEKREKELRLKGLENTDADYFQTVMQYAVLKTKRIAEDIMGGNIAKNPMVKDGVRVCEYCPYTEVCRFDDRYGGNNCRYPKYRESDREKVYEEMKRLLGGEAFGMDEGTAEGD